MFFAGGGIGSNGGLCLNRETFLFWQHLANAGLIEGQYSGAIADGVHNGGGNGPIPGLSAPDSGLIANYPGGSTQFPDLVWMVLSQGTMQGSLGVPRYNNPPYNNALALAAVATSPSYFYWQGMYPADAYFIDSKIDDGIANTGHIQAVQTGNCYNTTTGAYLVLTNSGACSLTFNNAF